MSIIPVPGASYDLYREHIFNNPGTYAQSGTQILTDDFKTNIQPQRPSRPGDTVIAQYATQPVADSIHTQNRGDFFRSAWTSSFPVIPSF